MKNVLQICNYAATYDGNFICSLQRLNDTLMDADSKNIYLFPYEAKSVSSSWLKEFEKVNNVYYFNGKLFDDVMQIKSIISANNIGVINNHFTKNELDIATYLATRGKKVKCFKHYHNHVENRQGIKKTIAQTIFKNFTLVAVGDSIYDNVKSKFPASSVRTVKNAVDLKRLDVFKKLTKSEFRLDENSTVCLIMGFSFQRKGVDLALKAINDLNNEGKNISLLILADDEANKKTEIINVLETVPQWVKVVPTKKDIATYYNFADIFLSPSREEGLCYSILEAAYCKDLIVLSNCGGLDEINIPNMFKFESENIDELKKAINLAVSHKYDFEMEKVQAKKCAENEYDLDVWAKTMFELYKRHLS